MIVCGMARLRAGEVDADDTTCELGSGGRTTASESTRCRRASMITLPGTL